MRDISSFEIKAFIEESKNEIEGAFIKSFSQINENRFRIELYKQNKKFLLISFKPKLICLTKILEEAMQPNSEVMRIRKLLKGKKIIRISQEGLERIIKFDCGDLQIIIDFTPNSNIFIQTKQQKIKLFKKAEISLKEKEKPKSKFFELFEKGVAPLYANEYIQRNLSIEVGDWLNQLIKRKEYLLFRNGRIKDYAITKIQKYSNFKAENFNSINSLLDNVYKQIIEEENEEFEKEKKEKIEKLKKILAQQEENIKELENEEKKYREIGDYIFQHLNEINELIKKARNGEIKVIFDGKRKKIIVEKI
jgi:predicted ribosome quality control (RQC) complex YloA/Tae2 family protein